MGSFKPDGPKRILDVVQGWEGVLSKVAKNAISKHDKLELVRRLEERLSEVVEPIITVRLTEPEFVSMPRQVLDARERVIENLDACMRSAPASRLPE